jgi:molecular chaperone GrpE
MVEQIGTPTGADTSAPTTETSAQTDEDGEQGATAAALAETCRTVTEQLSHRLVETEKTLDRLARAQTKSTLLWEQSLAQHQEALARQQESWRQSARLQEVNDELLAELARQAEARGRKQVEESLLPELLALADSLFQATAALRRQAEREPRLAEWAAGIMRLHERSERLLASFDIAPIPAAGLPFDPEQHQAVEVVVREDVECTTVVEEIMRGYRRAGKLMRTATVVVAKPGQPDEVATAEAGAGVAESNRRRPDEELILL